MTYGSDLSISFSALPIGVMQINCIKCPQQRITSSILSLKIKKKCFTVSFLSYYWDVKSATAVIFRRGVGGGGGWKTVKSHHQPAADSKELWQ